MQVAVFARIKNELTKQFFSEMSRFHFISPNIYQEYSCFAKALVESKANQSPVIFFASDHGDIDYAISLKQQLLRMKLIMVLPEKSSNMVSRALSLNPSLLMFCNNDLGNSTSIMIRLLAAHPTDTILAG